MENASKALIIAGAILVSILIISLGILIYNQAAGVINNNAMNETEMTQFNSKFTQYEGNKVSGSTVNALLQTVLQNNLNNKDNNLRCIQVTGTCTLTTKATKITTKAQTSATYKVEVTAYNTDGLVSTINITKN